LMRWDKTSPLLDENNEHIRCIAKFHLGIIYIDTVRIVLGYKSIL